MSLSIRTLQARVLTLWQGCSEEGCGVWEEKGRGEEEGKEREEGEEREVAAARAAAPLFPADGNRGEVRGVRRGEEEEEEEKRKRMLGNHKGGDIICAAEEQENKNPRFPKRCSSSCEDWCAKSAKHKTAYRDCVT